MTTPTWTTGFVYRHHFLHMLLTGIPQYFTTLSFSQQRVLHEFYRPAEKLTDGQLLEHLSSIFSADPTLPAAADRAFRKLERIYLLVSKQAGGDPARLQALLRPHIQGTAGAPDKRGRRLRVTGLARPEIDSRAVARAVVALARELAAEDDQSKAA